LAVVANDDPNKIAIVHSKSMEAANVINASDDDDNDEDDSDYGVEL